jgi:hypothetical protein
VKAVPFGAIAKVFNGNSISVAEKDKHYRGVSGTPYIGTAEVGFDTAIDYHSGVAIPDEMVGSFRIAKAGTPLVCAEGGSAGRKIGITDRSVCFGNKLFAIEVGTDWDGRFIFYFCQSEAFQQQFRALMTGMIGGVSIKKFKEIQIPVFPLPEQQRIVRILDQAFEAIATVMANTERNLLNAKELFDLHLQNFLQKCSTNGGVKPLLDLCDKDRGITYGVIKLGDHIESGIHCLRTSNVRKLHIELDGIKRISPDISDDYSRTVLKGGELLVNVRGTLGGVAVVPDYAKGWNVSREVAVAPIDRQAVDPTYVILKPVESDSRRVLLWRWA